VTALGAGWSGVPIWQGKRFSILKNVQLGSVAHTAIYSTDSGITFRG